VSLKKVRQRSQIDHQRPQKAQNRKPNAPGNSRTPLSKNANFIKISAIFGIFEINLFVNNGKILHAVLYAQDFNCYIWPKIINTPGILGKPKRG
jgi:hypothetical protein